MHLLINYVYTYMDSQCHLITITMLALQSI